MSRWFRLYGHDVLNDPKVQRLSPPLFKAWINILCAASENAGIVPERADLAFLLRKSEEAVCNDVDALVSVGLLDEAEGVTRPHNWDGRQFKADVSNERVKRHRERRRNVTPAVTATPPETDTEPEKEEPPSLRSGGARAPAKRGERLPDDFAPDLDEALALGLTLTQAMSEAAKFKDHWRQASGQNARKLDWPAAWRNWCRRAVDDFRGRGPPAAKPQNGYAALALEMNGLANGNERHDNRSSPAERAPVAPPGPVPLAGYPAQRR